MNKKGMITKSKNEGSKECDVCKWCVEVLATGGWSFMGCTYGEYKRKWVREIKKCPKLEVQE